MDDARRTGAAQPKRFDPARAARLDDPERFTYLPASDLLELLALDHGGVMLDFGAGTGTYAIAFARARPDLRILALDEQPEMLAFLQQNVRAAGVTSIQPLEPDQLAAIHGQIDRLFALNVLHELGDAALAGIAPLLRTGGLVVFVDWNAEVERPHGPPRHHVYNITEAQERITANGLRVTSVRRFPYHYALVCSVDAPSGGTA